MALTFIGEVHRINEIEPRGDFEGGATLTLSDEDSDISIWIPRDDLAKVRSLRRLQRVTAVLRARESQYTTARDGATRNTKALKLSLISITPENAAPAKAA